MNYHYYQCLKKAFYKPGAWFQGILFPLATTGTIREADIIGSICQILSIPVAHSSGNILSIYIYKN